VNTLNPRRRFWGAAPAIAALLAYAATLGAGFLYDDESLIRTNRWVQDAGVLLQLPAKPLLASPPLGVTNYYRPMVNILYNLTWQSLGGRPLAFHLLNVLLHMLNATLVFRLVRRIRGAQDVTAIGAAVLFAVHPLNVEVVAWPSCLPELGYVAFGLSALLLQVTAWSEKEPRARGLRIASYVLFGLACGFKETALAFVPLIVLAELWLRPARDARSAPSVGTALARVLPYLGAFAVYLAARTAVLGGLIPPGGHGLRTAADAVWNAPWLLLLYLKSMMFPSPILIEHVVTLAKSAADPRFLVGVAIAGAAIAAVYRLRRTHPDLAFAACLTVVPLLPALYLPGLGRDPFAERYAYLGVAGFSWLLVGGLDALARRAPAGAPRWALPALIYALVLLATARTVARCGDWYDDGALGRASMRDEPRAPIGYLLAGNWNLREGRKEEALAIFKDGATHVPESVELQQNAIGLGIQLGHLTEDDAIAEYQRLVPLASGSASAQYNLGQALLQRGRLDEAKAAFERALALSPASIPSMTALAVVASQQGDPATAVRYCRQALAIDDHSVPALQQLGVAQLRAGDVPGAIASLERAVQLDPADKESLSRLGVAYAKSGRLDDARKSWERALTIDPQFASALQNLERLRRTAP